MIAVLFFSFQIYCDFSGYSDIAIGTAHLFGINLMSNFRNPYFAPSVREFWKRWHISLSSWFCDYVYIPLGGNRKGKVRKYINTLITFLLSGLWHGANWTFVLWGGIHGCAQIIEDIFHGNKKDKKSNILSITAVFLFVTFAWIFFRAETLQQAVYVISHMFIGIFHPITYIKNGLIELGIGKLAYIKIGIPLLVLFAFEQTNLKKDPLQEISKLCKPIRWGVYWIFIIVLSVYCVQNIAQNQFVYFQF
ncbi:MAG: hypothetical protein NC331_00455 [Lachnospiraceae bacterium]|nr:hypothetical protein [Lachnospiraceae bacterium]MCM1237838.1 hypothetical protein [Lachnospiraceae bacterium]